MSTVSIASERLKEINADRKNEALSALAVCPATWTPVDGQWLVVGPLVALEALTHVEVERRGGGSSRQRISAPIEHLGTVWRGGYEHGFAAPLRANGTPR